MYCACFCYRGSRDVRHSYFNDAQVRRRLHIQQQNHPSNFRILLQLLLDCVAAFSRRVYSVLYLKRSSGSGSARTWLLREFFYANPDRHLACSSCQFPDLRFNHKRAFHHGCPDGDQKDVLGAQHHVGDNASGDFCNDRSVDCNNTFGFRISLQRLHGRDQMEPLRFQTPSLLSKAPFQQPPYRLAIPEIAIVVDSVIWVFWTAYVAGEIRNANQTRRNISSMAGAAILNAAFFITLVYLLYSKVGIPFLSGITLAGYTSALPFSSTLQALSAVLVLSTGSFVAGVIVLTAITLGYSVLLLPALYLQPIRSIFAWSFDRVVPLRWSSVNSRFHTPLLSTVGVFAIIEVALILITVESNFLYGIFSAAIIAPAFSSIFATSIAAIVLGFKKRNMTGKGSNHRIALLGCISLAFILFMTFEYLSNESYFFDIPSSGLSSTALIALNFIFIPIGALIYFISYSLRKRNNNIDLNAIASQIPPE